MRKIRRRCKCGCGEITNYGRKWINGHYWRNKKHSVEAREKMSLVWQGRQGRKGHKHSAETKEKMSLAKKGKKHSAEHILSNSLAHIKYDPNNPYCDVWKDIGYRDDIRKDHCENKDCKKICERLCNHHIYLDKKRCAPIDIMTLCNSCHGILHAKLQRGSTKTANPKDFIIINRPDHVSYIHKKSREIIKLRRLTWQSIQ